MSTENSRLCERNPLPVFCVEAVPPAAGTKAGQAVHLEKGHFQMKMPWKSLFSCRGAGVHTPRSFRGEVGLTVRMGGFGFVFRFAEVGQALGGVSIVRAHGIFYVS